MPEPLHHRPLSLIVKISTNCNHMTIAMPRKIKSDDRDNLAENPAGIEIRVLIG
jgi:hypothetical protein